MTRNQIEYWRLKETERSNRANEQHNRNVLNYNYAVLEETKRSNLAREAETYRSNRERERLNDVIANRNWQLSLRQQVELERANQAAEAIKREMNAETQRANRASEQIRYQQNLLTQRQQVIEHRKASETERYNRELQALEQRRINVAAFGNVLNYASNYQRNIETTRANQASEQIRRQNILLDYNRLEEQRRHSVATEQETMRSNIAQETLRGTEIGTRATTDILGTFGRVASTQLRRAN